MVLVVIERGNLRPFEGFFKLALFTYGDKRLHLQVLLVPGRKWPISGHIP